MSTNRTIPLHVKAVRPHSEDGKPLCRFCKGALPPHKRSFCSQGCIHEWNIRCDPRYARSNVWKRDRGVCQGCGVDTVVRARLDRPADFAHVDSQLEQDKITEHEYVWTLYSLSSPYWQMDHIIPVIEGGGECGLENLRTLCTGCHKEVTRELAARRSVVRVFQAASERECQMEEVADRVFG